MRSNKKIMRRIPAAIAVSALLLLAGRAAMASNTVGSSVSGFGTGTVSGATVQNVTYALSADGVTITGATLTLVGDLSGKVVAAGFNAAALTTCTVGAYIAGANTTSATCAGLSQNNAAATTLAVSVRQ